MPRRIDLGRAVLAGGAALLFVTLFLRWYDTGPTAWQAFEALDLLLAAIAAGGIAVAVWPDAAPRWAAWGLPAAAVLIVAVQIVNPPPAAGDTGAAIGAWLALAAGALMAGGAVLSLTSVSILVEVQPQDPRRHVPAVDRRDGAQDAVAEPVDVPADAEAPVTRSGRFRQRGAAPAPPAPEPVAAVAEDDAQRTQPLHPLDDPNQRPEST